MCMFCLTDIEHTHNFFPLSSNTSSFNQSNHCKTTEFDKTLLQQIHKFYYRSSGSSFSTQGLFNFCDSHNESHRNRVNIKPFGKLAGLHDQCHDNFNFCMYSTIPIYIGPVL